MKCRVCGYDIDPNRAYCEMCGTKVVIPAAELKAYRDQQKNAQPPAAPAPEAPANAKPTAPLSNSVDNAEFSWNTYDFPKPKRPEDIPIKWPEYDYVDPEAGTFMTPDGRIESVESLSRPVAVMSGDASEGYVAVQQQPQSRTPIQPAAPAPAPSYEQRQPYVMPPVQPRFEQQTPIQPPLQNNPYQSRGFATPAPVAPAPPARDQFFTFNKKNEEFQKLLDKEYERLSTRQAGEPYVEQPFNSMYDRDMPPASNPYGQASYDMNRQPYGNQGGYGQQPIQPQSPYRGQPYSPQQGYGMGQGQYAAPPQYNQQYNQPNMFGRQIYDEAMSSQQHGYDAYAQQPQLQQRQPQQPHHQPLQPAYGNIGGQSPTQSSPQSSMAAGSDGLSDFERMLMENTKDKDAISDTTIPVNLANIQAEIRAQEEARKKQNEEAYKAQLLAMKRQDIEKRKAVFDAELEKMNREKNSEAMSEDDEVMAAVAAMQREHKDSSGIRSKDESGGKVSNRRPEPDTGETPHFAEVTESLGEKAFSRDTISLKVEELRAQEAADKKLRSSHKESIAAMAEARNAYFNDLNNIDNEEDEPSPARKKKNSGDAASSKAGAKGDPSQEAQKHQGAGLAGLSQETAASLSPEATALVAAINAKETDKDAPIDDLFTTFHDDSDWDENLPSSGHGFWKFLIAVILIIALAEGACIGLRRFAPDSSITATATNVEQQVISKVLSFGESAKETVLGLVEKVKGRFGGEEEPIEEPLEPTFDLGAIVTQYNKNIKSVTQSPSLAYSPEDQYSIDGIDAMAVTEDTDTLTRIYTALIAYNSGWVDYVNQGQDKSCLDYLKADGSAYRNAVNFQKVGKLSEEFQSLMLGEVRNGGGFYYAFVREMIAVTEDGNTTAKTYSWIYRLEDVAGQIKIVDYTEF